MTTQGVKLRPGLAVADRVIVQFRPTAQMTTASSALSAVGGKVGRALGHGQYLVELPTGSDLTTALARLRGQAAVSAADADVLMYPALVPNDPKYSSQYHLPLINAPEGWDVLTGSTNVVIAVIDSGCDLDHPDLASKIWVNSDEIPGNKRDDDGNGYVDDVSGWDFNGNNNDPDPTPDGTDHDSNGRPDEEVSHGTLVAGIAAASSNDGWGCAGVSWGARIMPLQVFPSDGPTTVSTVIEAINYAVANGANIINLSMGGTYSAAFTTPLTAAYSAGVVIVVAGGNEDREFTDSDSTWESPVCNDGADVFSQNHIIGVAATNRYDVKASYSNFDSSSAHFIDLAAPGDAIYGPTAYFPAFPAFSAYWGTNSGTSFSAPVVSGAAALVLSQHPTYTPAQVLATLRNSCDNVDGLNPGFAGKLGGGRVNVARALGVILPPAKAQNLAGADTTGDDGGSITLTWDLSPDDGTGTDSVQSYRVFRRSGAEEATLLATLPAGSTSYVDATVTDGVDYYYKVRVSDGTLTSDTAEVGPVQSLNDGPPPAVSGLAAVDRPNDDGGTIRLTWDAFTAPADFKCFVIYRALRDFTSTLSMTPLALVSNATATQYLDATAADGVDYYYAVGTRDTAGNENRTLGGVGPVQCYPNGTVTFAAGLHFMGTPALPASLDPASLFGIAPANFHCARWSAAAGGYEQYVAGSVSSEMELGLGKGFWVSLPSSVQVTPAGQSAPAGDFAVDLTPGWHMLANPFFTPLDFGEATVTYNGATMDLMSAEASGILSAFTWIYDNAAQSYVLAYPDFDGSAVRIPPWRGFWVQAQQACTLTLLRPTAATTVAAAQTTPHVTSTASPRKVRWSLPVLASTRGVTTQCRVGVADRALLVAQPPAVAAAPLLTTSAAGQQSKAGYAVALAQTSATAIIWNLTLSQLTPGTAVKVATPDLSRLPADRVATLEDLSTGASVYLRTTPGYTFTPTAGETSRALRLTVGPRSTAPLMLSSVVARQTRTGTTQVSFTLSQAASCSIAVLNLAGRTVRVVENDSARTAGTNTAVWDGRNQSGTLTPSGLYLLRVQAHNPSGESTGTVTPVRIQR